MIYVLGDLHGELHRLTANRFPNGAKLTRDDYVIVCGDFGGVWDGSPRERKWLNILEEEPFTTLFIDGNHENHAMLNALPVSEWNGGRVHEVRPHILHLMRGQMFRLDGMTFFTMGGAASHDIEDGILDPKAPDYTEQLMYMRYTNAMFRVLGKSWWPEEMPSDEEYAEAERNLDKAGWRVDYVLTHCAPTSIVRQLGRQDEVNCLTDFLQTVKRRCEFDCWFMGHYHMDTVLDEKFVIQYRQMTELEMQ